MNLKNHFAWTLVPCIFATTLSEAAPLIVTPLEHESFRFDVAVEVDGVPKIFQLDTGANTSLMPRNAFTSAYPSVEKKKSSGASGVTFECDVIQTGLLKLNEVLLKNVKIQRCDLGDIDFNNLGLNAFDGRIVELILATKQITIGEAPTTSWQPKPLERLSKGHLLIPVTVGSLSLKSIYDTGAQISAVDLAFVKLHPEIFTFERTVQSSDVHGLPVELELYRMKSLTVGSLSSGPLLVGAFDFGEALRNYFGNETPIILGTNLIVNANWLIDLKNNQWDVHPIF